MPSSRCVGVSTTSGPCSTGPGVIATMSFSGVGTPWIMINVSGSTIVHGNTF